MFLDLILARVGLINLSNEIDPGMKAGFTLIKIRLLLISEKPLKESISSVIWVQPRIVTECPELKIVCDEFTKKYGKGLVEYFGILVPRVWFHVSRPE